MTADLPPMPPDDPGTPHVGRPLRAAPSTGGVRAPIATSTDTYEPLRVPTPAEVAEEGWVKEQVWAYENRPRGRSAQASLGPSEFGTECERKLVYKLQGTTPFGHGSGANWPAIVGTGVHTWFANMMTHANGDRGRYLIEHGVTIVEGEVTGTLDLYDRVQRRVRDWKFPSLRAVHKYRREGVGTQYRTQGQIYGMGLAMAGETPKDIAVVMIARDAASIDQGIHVEIFPYQPDVANEAIARYRRLKETADSGVYPLDVTPTMSALCNYCPFMAPGVPGACPGQ